MPLKKGPAIKCLLLILLPGVLINFLAPAVWAVNPNDPVNIPEYPEPETTALPSMAVLFFKIILCLGVIVILTYGLIRLLRKQFKTTGSTWINIVDQISLGPNRGLFLANIAGKIVALGITDHQIVKIMEIDDPEIIEQIREQPQPAVPKGMRLPYPGRQETKNVDRFHYLIQDNLSRIRSLMEEKSGD